MKKGGFVYIITNKYNKILYTGSTVNLRDRIWEHISKQNPNSFSAKYNCNKIVYYEFFPTINEAIEREYQIKSNSRQYKINLINNFNPEWMDHWDNIQDY